MSDDLEPSRERLWDLVTASLHQEIERRRSIQTVSTTALAVALAAFAILPAVLASESLSRVIFNPPSETCYTCLLWCLSSFLGLGAIGLLIFALFSLFKNLTFATFWGLPNPYALWEHSGSSEMKEYLSDVLKKTIEPVVTENEKENDKRVHRLRRCAWCIMLALTASLLSVILFAFLAAHLGAC